MMESQNPRMHPLSSGKWTVYERDCDHVRIDAGPDLCMLRSDEPDACVTDENKVDVVPVVVDNADTIPSLPGAVMSIFAVRRSCAACLKEVTTRESCGRCRQRYYCDNKCRGIHWNDVHWKQCRSYIKHRHRYRVICCVTSEVVDD